MGTGDGMWILMLAKHVTGWAISPGPSRPSLFKGQDPVCLLLMKASHKLRVLKPQSPREQGLQGRCWLTLKLRTGVTVSMCMPCLGYMFLEKGHRTHCLDSTVHRAQQGTSHCLGLPASATPGSVGWKSHHTAC